MKGFYEIMAEKIRLMTIVHVPMTNFMTKRQIKDLANISNSTDPLYCFKISNVLIFKSF